MNLEGGKLVQIQPGTPECKITREITADGKYVMVSDRKTLQCFGSLWAWVTPLFAWRTGAFCGFGSSDGPEIHIQYSGNSPVDAEHLIFRGERSTIHRNTSPTLSLGTKGGPGMFRLQNNFYLQGHFLSARTSRPFVIRPRADSWVINWVWMSVRLSGKNVSFYQDETLVAIVSGFPLSIRFFP